MPHTPRTSPTPAPSLTLVRHTPEAPPPARPAGPSGPADPQNPRREPGGDGLAYSLTLPAALSTPAIARRTTAHILAAHHLPELTDAAVQAVGELTATACQLTTEPRIYLSLRYRAEALRIAVHDSEPHPANPHLAAALATRRRSALRLLARVVKSCEGTWGHGEAPPPSTGTRTWAVLPHATTATYTHP